MELIVFIVFQLLMEVQSYKSPTVKVSPDVIRESSSVKISCETPADVTVNQCYFYINREEKNIKVSSSCDLDLTGAEVLRWAAVKSPESIYINCYYTIHERDINKPSSESPPATVTVLDSLQKPIISVTGDNDILSCEIPLSVRSDFICSLYTEDDVLLYQRVSQRSQSGKNLCMFYLNRSELFTRSVNSRQLICVYSLKTEPEIRSPHSDTYTIRVSTPTTTEQTTTTTMKTYVQSMTNLPTSKAKETTNLQSKTNLPTNIAKETITATTQKTPQTDIVMSTSDTPVSHRTDIWFIVLVFTGVTVILSGLVGLICLCRFACKKRRKLNKTRPIKTDETTQGIGMSCSGPAETYSLITYVPETSQPISADVLVNKQQKRGNPEENENVYHLYSTIPDKPVHSNTQDHVYSLLKMH